MNNANISNVCTLLASFRAGGSDGLVGKGMHNTSRAKRQRPSACLVLLLCGLCLGGLGACTSIRSAPVQSSGTPNNPFANPGGQNMPGQEATGVAARSY